MKVTANRIESMNVIKMRLLLVVADGAKLAICRVCASMGAFCVRRMKFFLAFGILLPVYQLKCFAYFVLPFFRANVYATVCVFEIFGRCCRCPSLDYGRVQMILIKNPTLVQQQKPVQKTNVQEAKQWKGAHGTTTPEKRVNNTHTLTRTHSATVKKKLIIQKMREKSTRIS